MADSDAEYDRKRSEKFHSERKSNGGGGGGPPMKYMRAERGDNGRSRHSGHDAYPKYGGGVGWGHYPKHGGHPSAGMLPRGSGNAGSILDAAYISDMQTQPPRLTLKQFLDFQDDSISNSAAITKYIAYKQDFKRQQLNTFFETHKDEEWFKIKYHPEECHKRKEEKQNFLKRRADVFAELLTNGTVTAVNVDTSQTEKLLRLLDTVVIKLEGGTDEDLKALDAEAVALEAVLNRYEGQDLEDGETSMKKNEDAVEAIDLDKENDPKDAELGLHKTSSIFLRNLAITITKSEVEAMFNQYNGFLRVGLVDPLVERRWFRRCFVTFQRGVNIKHICWNLNNKHFCEPDAIVNRELTRRVRPINGITSHKTIVRSDIKLCANIAFNLDLKAGLWQSDENSKSMNGGASLVLNSDNPVLQNITDYLIEEASAEGDELLGQPAGENKDTDGDLLTVLDQLILYLRVVHSFDFYNHCEYPYEDEMPNRCGFIHARGPAPQNKITQTEVQDYIRNFEGKMSSFLAKSQAIKGAELKKLGCKDPDAEVEKFVLVNTQALAKNKWLCPLSGEKFNGPDFIRKHIFNEHGEKVNGVKKDVEYFNNYLSDPKRPQLPEHPVNSRKPAV